MWMKLHPNDENIVKEKMYREYLKIQFESFQAAHPENLESHLDLHLLDMGLCLF